MRIHALQHVLFEDVGSMARDFKQRGFSLTTTHWYLDDATPAVTDFDALVVMGGPMGVDDEAQYPWLAAEKRLIKEAIDAGKIVLGICLGAQLIAQVLGAKVSRNPHREIGWFPLTLQTDPAQSPLENALPGGVEVFHWHGDTFELPAGARWLASSTACAHQAFSYGHNVFGFQFHLETTEASARALLHECADELDGSTFVQNAGEILNNSTRFDAINKIMSAVLAQILDKH
jgi:GMP synthase-like glutamine amidotransferase